MILSCYLQKICTHWLGGGKILEENKDFVVGKADGNQWEISEKLGFQD